MIDFEFRAFDKEIKKIFYVGSIIQALKQNNECEDDHWLLNTDHDLMLYTGLKDKNEKKYGNVILLKYFGVIHEFILLKIIKEVNRLFFNGNFQTLMIVLTIVQLEVVTLKLSAIFTRIKNS